MASQPSQSQREYVEGPSNHQQLLQGKASFARFYQAHGSTVSGFVAEDVIESQRDDAIGTAFLSGGMKYVSLKNLGPTMEQLNNNKKNKKKLSKGKTNK